MRLLCAAVAAVALAFGATSCGDADADPADGATAALADLREHFDGGRYRQACAGMTPAARSRAFDSADVAACADGLAELADRPSRTLSSREVLSVKAREQTARVLVDVDPRMPGALRLVESADGWKLDDLAVTPLLERSTWKEAHDVGQLFYIYRDGPNGKRVACPRFIMMGDGEGMIDGGCPLRISSQNAPVVLLTAFGSFEVARCRAGYDLYVGETGVVANRVTFSGAPPCDRIEHCAHGETKLTYPWQGERIAERPGLVTRLHVCINTPYGRIRGYQMTRISHRDGDWTARPLDYPVADGSLHLGGSWDIEPDDFEVRTGASPYH